MPVPTLKLNHTQTHTKISTAIILSIDRRKLLQYLHKRELICLYKSNDYTLRAI